MSNRISKEILKHSVFIGLLFSILYSFPLLIDVHAMDPIYLDQNCIDIDGDGIYNHDDPDIDNDGILNNDDPDIDNDGLIDDDDYVLPNCEISLSNAHYYIFFIFIVLPILSAFMYRRKVDTLVYRECFSICFLTLAVGTILGQLINTCIYTSFNFNLEQLLTALQAGVMGLVICAAYSFLLAFFLKKN